MSIFRPNLESKGRWIRGICALGLAAAAVVVWRQSRAAGSALGIAAAFVAFEAARGWCALRACGVKTKF